MSRGRTAAVWALKAAVTAGLLTWLLTRPEIRQGLVHPGPVDWRWMAAGLVSAGLGQVFAAWRWAACLRVTGVTLRPLVILRLTLIGAGAAFLSIGSLGADAVRVALAARRVPQRKAALLGSIGLDHASAFPGMVLIGLGVLASAGASLSVGQGAWIAIGLSVVVFFGVGLLLRRFRPEWHHRLRRFLLERTTRRGFLTAVLVALPMLVFYYGTFLCTGRALGVNVPAPDLLGAAAAADVVAALPISVAGLGVREQAFQTLLGLWHHVPASEAVALSLAGLALMMIWGIVGAICFLFEPAAAAASPDADPTPVPDRDAAARDPSPPPSLER